ncbi:MAG: OmpA family protein [Burkholderiaceae bacterium]
MSKPTTTQPSRRRLKPLLCAVALTGLFVQATPSLAQVTIFEKPPTADELRRALRGGAAAGPQIRSTPKAFNPLPERPSGVRTRGIVWKQQDQGLPANTAQQPTPAAQTANAPTEQALGYSGSSPAAGMPINFASGSANIERDSYGFIQTVAEVLRSDPSMRLIIEGHTNSTGSYNRNMVLSWERAMGVYRVLVEEFGIEPTRLQLSGKGPSEPLPGTAPADGSNRRVQFRLNG